MAQDFQREKQLVLSLYAELDAARIADIPDVLGRYVSADYLWQGFHPFHEQSGPNAVSESFWRPLRQSFSHMQRRLDIFMAGQNVIEGDDGIWVVSMGHLMGLFDEPWLGIPPSGKMAFLRYCAFHKVEGDRITRSAMFFDIPHLMMQVGLRPFPSQTAAHLVQPGPMTHDGLLYGVQPAQEGEKTLAAIEFMINDIATWSGGRSEPLEDELRRSWNEDMIWWGPAGIGATYTIERYAKQHSGPFRAGFGERQFNGHVAKIAEGHFGGFFGWPNLTLTPTGGFMGLPATGKAGDMRVIDIYRRSGDKLTENWIFIDLLHFWNQQGMDVLARIPEMKSGY